ncbi:hypothetical protein GEMRC1_011083 [Eukaryota sp. GEM-RC1]
MFNDFSVVTPLESLASEISKHLLKWTSEHLFPSSSFAAEFLWQNQTLRLVFVVDIFRNHRFTRWYGTDISLILGLSTQDSPSAPYSHANPFTSETLIPLLSSALAISLQPLFTLEFPRLPFQLDFRCLLTLCFPSNPHQTQQQQLLRRQGFPSDVILPTLLP